MHGIRAKNPNPTQRTCDREIWEDSHYPLPTSHVQSTVLCTGFRFEREIRMNGMDGLNGFGSVSEARRSFLDPQSSPSPSTFTALYSTSVLETHAPSLSPYKKSKKERKKERKNKQLCDTVRRERPFVHESSVPVSVSVSFSVSFD